LNIIGGISEKMNLRVAASQTICRPEARELAPFQFYDYNVFLLVEGNPNLQRTKITNLDLRYEFYPASGQVLSASVFGKYFENPIEKKLENAGSFNLMRYINAPSAYTYGAELEYRVSLGTFYKWFRGKTTEKGFFHGLYLFGNVALIKSEVNLSGVAGTEGSRPLQGQSPYIINAGVQYNDSKYDFGVSIAYNRIGQRIVSIGFDTYPSFWETPRNVLDIQLTKTFWKKLELKLNARDILANPTIWYQNNDKKTSFGAGDNEILRIIPGATYSFSIGFNL
jgi:outer membrane receptor protein involved in Fe transport